MKEPFFLYVRKSTDTEDKQVQSLDDQINSMYKKAELLGIEIVEVFSESMSAKKPGRYKFNEMIDRIQKGEVRGIISWKLDRLTRNPIDTGTIQYMLQDGILDKIITNDREYLPIDAGLLFSVETGMSNQFILDLKKNVKRGMDYKTDNGMYCGKAPEGYINNRLEKTIEIDPERFDLVRNMWDLMLTGSYSIAQIVRIANNDWGFIRKRQGKQGGCKLGQSGLYKMFTNIFYTGDFYWLEQVKKGVHQPMISYDEFNRVQELLGERGIDLRNKTREFAYTGFIKCGECGSAITAVEKNKTIKATGEKKTYVYYYCTKRRKGCTDCSQKPIRLEDLEEQIETVILQLQISPIFRKWLIEGLKDDFRKDTLNQENILLNLQKTLKESERKLNKLTDSLLDEIIEKDEYMTRKKHLSTEINSHREKIQKMNNKKDETVGITENVFDFLIQAHPKFNYGSLMEKKEILLGLGGNFTLCDQKLLFDLYDWFQPIQGYHKIIMRKKPPLEPLKNSTVKLISSAVSFQKCNWYSHGELNSDLSLEKAAS